MAEITETTPVDVSFKIVEDCVEFARRKGAEPYQVEGIDREDQRATVRMLFTHPLRYCANETLAEDHIKSACTLDISLGGIALWCPEALTVGAVIHVLLPQLDGKNAWVRGRVIYCQPGIEHYRAGIAFIFGQN